MIQTIILKENTHIQYFLYYHYYSNCITKNYILRKRAKSGFTTRHFTPSDHLDINFFLTQALIRHGCLHISIVPFLSSLLYLRQWRSVDQSHPVQLSPLRYTLWCLQSHPRSTYIFKPLFKWTEMAIRRLQKKEQTLLPFHCRCSRHH